MNTPNEDLGPVAKLQDIRTVIEDDCQHLLRVAGIYEDQAKLTANLSDAERLLTLAREAREREANLRMTTQWRTDQ